MPASELSAKPALSAVLEGALSVQAALDARSRPIIRVDIARDATRQPIIRAADTARRRGIPVQVVDRHELDDRATSRTHGGIVALVGARRFVPPGRLGEGIESPFLAVLDGVEYPYGFG